jgi:hypothetical protein
LTLRGRKSIKEGLFFELILQGEEDEHRPFSAVTITSRLGSNPLTGGFFVSGGGDGFRFNAVSADSFNGNSLRIFTPRSYGDTPHKTTVHGL